MTDTETTQVTTTAPPPTGTAPPALQVDGLSVRFATRAGTVAALTDAHLRLPAGHLLVVAGESGSGKSVLAAAVLQTLPANATTTGSVRIGGQLLSDLSPAAQRRFRRRHVAYIPQSPATALNPVRTIGSVLVEIAQARGLGGGAAVAALRTALSELDLDFDQVAGRYPHQLSGGMQQRVLNALAMVGTPTLVIADEPTSSLDPELVEATAEGLRRLTDQGAAVLVITHDLRLAQRLGGWFALLYGSHLVETRATERFFAQPAHPYGRGLLAAMPEHGGVPIPGQPPELTALPPGCPFQPRCPVRVAECDGPMPPAEVVAGDGTEPGRVHCYRYDGGRFDAQR